MSTLRKIYESAKREYHRTGNLLAKQRGKNSAKARGIESAYQLAKREYHRAGKALAKKGR